MAKLTILDNEFASMWYHTDTGIVHHQIKKYIFGERLQDLLNKGTEAIAKYQARKWLSDDRKNNALTQQDQEWTRNIWLPKTARVGWKFWALVQPAKVTGQLNMKKTANFVTDSGVLVATFNDPDEAMEWLKQQ